MSRSLLLSLFFIFCLSAALYLFLYIKSCKNLIIIQFAGGKIAFDIRWFSEEEISNFQKQLRLAKDKAVEEADNVMARNLKDAVIAASGNKTQFSRSVADELANYGELLNKGLITREEFDKKKKELL